MRYFFLFLCFWLLEPGLSGQNYYVAIVRGKVYYENKLLKKRDKIKMQGTLRFTSKADYVKVSGPGGMYTLDPGMDLESGSEFLVAVREEFFPKIRPHATSQQVIAINFYENSWFQQAGKSQTFLDKTYLLSQVPELNEDEELGFLHETGKGLMYKTASVENGQLQIREKDFTKALKANLRQTAIVKVTDRSRWLQLIEGKDSIAQIHDFADHYSKGMEAISAPEATLDPETGKIITIITAEEVLNPAEILDYMGPPRFVNRRKMVKDLRFHLRLCKAPDLETFLNDFEYEYYIDQTYGILREYPDLMDVLTNDLKLNSKYKLEPVQILPDNSSN